MVSTQQMRPIFILGCPRSGTSLLRDLLRSHPNLTFPPESHFIPQFYRAYGNPKNDQEALQLSRTVLRLHWIKRWGLDVTPSQFAACRSYREFLVQLYASWTAKESRQRWGDKTPNYLTEIPTLFELFPEAQFVHLFRDGRDVAMSWRKSGFEPGNLYTAAKLWQQRVGQAMSDGRKLPSNSYMEIRYEDLVADPGSTLSRVYEFLGEQASGGTLRAGPLPGSHSNKGRDVLQNSQKWRTQMSPAQRRLVESVAGALLRKLGYPLEGNSRNLSSVERFLWTCHHVVIVSARHLWWSARPAAALTGLENRLASIRGRKKAAIEK